MLWTLVPERETEDRSTFSEAAGHHVQVPWPGIVLRGVAGAVRTPGHPVLDGSNTTAEATT